MVLVIRFYYFRVVLMVDLSEPNSLWFTLESLMGALNSHLQHSIKVHYYVPK